MTFAAGSSAVVAWPVAPRWLRAAMLAGVVAVHAWAFAKLSAPTPVIPLPAIAVEFTTLPEPLPAPASAAAPALEPEAAPAVMDPAESAPPPPPQPLIESAVPEPQGSPPTAVKAMPTPSLAPTIDATPAPAPQAIKPPPPRRDERARAQKRDLPVKQIVKPEARAASVKPATADRATATAKPATATTAPSAHGNGRQTSSAPTISSSAPSMSTASYAALVAAELNRHKSYPESARASGASGAVGVAFSIGPSGRATSIAITSSSGNPTLDGAARQAVASIRAPAPPGGSFRTATTIRFSLR